MENNSHHHHFIEYCRDQLALSKHSLLAYQQDLKAFVRYLSDNESEAEVTSRHILEYRIFLRDRLNARPATIRRRLVTLRSYFRWLADTDANFVSPFDGLRLDLRIPKRLPRPVDRAVLHALITSYSGSKLTSQQNLDLCWKNHNLVTNLIVRILLVTGLRIGELTALQISDISPSGEAIRVFGKGNRERTAYIRNKDLLADFRAYRSMRLRTANASEALFINVEGKPLTPPAFRKRLRTLSDSLALEPRITPHRFRHSAATLLIEEGVDIRLVQRLLGHASIVTTELYTKVTDSSLISAIERADTLASVNHR